MAAPSPRVGLPAKSAIAADLQTFQQFERRLCKLLAYELPTSTLRAIFLSRMPYFFVQGDFSHLQSRIDPIYRLLKNKAPEVTSVPSKPDLTALTNRAPLNLFSILRLGLTSKLILDETASFSLEIHHDGSALIENRSVIPCIRHAEPDTIRKWRAECDLSEPELVERMNRYLAQQSLIHGRPKPIPRYFFTDGLEKGLPLRGRPSGKHFRITTETAIATCHALTGKTDRKQLTEIADTVFPEDNTSGPGNGMYTAALPADNGNQIFFCT